MNTKLRKELEKQDSEELIRLISEMATRFPIAKMYLTMEFGFEGKAIVEKYKKAILKEYFPTRGHGKARSSKVNRILKEFSQIVAFQEDKVEMQLYQLEQAVLYYRSYHHDHEAFLKNLYKNWADYLLNARQQGLLESHQSRIDLMFPAKFKTSWVGRQLENIYTAIESGNWDEVESLKSIDF